MVFKMKTWQKEIDYKSVHFVYFGSYEKQWKEQNGMKNSKATKTELEESLSLQK
jgi:hypothetical protein